MAKPKATKVDFFSTLEEAKQLAASGASAVDVRCTVDSVPTARKMVMTLLQSKLQHVRAQLPIRETELGWALKAATLATFELVDRRMPNHEVTYSFERDGDKWALEVSVPVVPRKVMGVKSTAIDGVYRDLEATVETIPRSALSKLTFTPKPKNAPPAARKRLDPIAKRLSF